MTVPAASQPLASPGGAVTSYSPARNASIVATRSCSAEATPVSPACSDVAFRRLSGRRSRRRRTAQRSRESLCRRHAPASQTSGQSLRRCRRFAREPEPLRFARRRNCLCLSANVCPGRPSRFAVGNARTELLHLVGNDQALHEPADVCVPHHAPLRRPGPADDVLGHGAGAWFCRATDLEYSADHHHGHGGGTAAAGRRRGGRHDRRAGRQHGDSRRDRRRRGCDRRPA